MFEKIVMATDLSDEWDAIIACAREFKALGCKRVVLTHVLVARGLVGTDTAALGEARPKLEAQKARLEDQGFEVEVETPVGLPAYSLNDVALKHCASLIVVGSHGKSAWREAILGSVASALLHHARFPISLALGLVRKEDISLILLGAQGKSLLSEIFLGSVAYNISRLAPCPVLLIPPVPRINPASAMVCARHLRSVPQSPR